MSGVANSAKLPKHTPLAIVGMGCRFPGADNLNEFWNLIQSGRSSYQEIPQERLDRELYFDPQKSVVNKSYSTLGGIVSDSMPSPHDCHLNADQLAEYDSAHLTFCDVVASAIKNAGYHPLNLPTNNVGVYVGHAGGSCDAGDLMYSAYIKEVAAYLDQLESSNNLPAEEREALKQGLINSVRDSAYTQKLKNQKLSASQAAGVVSRAFNLSGPQEIVDAACASSLVALFLASQALQTGQIDMAIVGGASYSKWYGMVLFSQAQSLSATGSRPFDEDADGLISSDGYGAVLVKTLEKAIADNDEILGVVNGIGISSDGRGKSLWAPLEKGQKKAIARAYQTDEQKRRIQYIECHATSTQVGDATELSALGDCFANHIAKDDAVFIGSVKGNVGHTLEAAGIAGLIKTVLAMQHGVIPPQANLNQLNSSVNWHELPFQVPTTAQDWKSQPDGGPKAASVNAFGIGGLNVHVTLEEHVGRQAGQRTSEISVSSNRELEPIAVVGMGSIFSDSQDGESLWQLMSTGKSGLTRIPPDRWSEEIYFSPNNKRLFGTKKNLGGFVTNYEYDWRRHKIPPKQIKSSNPLQYMLLDAAESALKSCGYEGDAIARDSTAVVVGTVFGGDFSCQLQMGLRLPDMKSRLEMLLQFTDRRLSAETKEQIISEFETYLIEQLPALHDETGSFTSSTLASRLSKTFNLNGGAFAIDADTSSSLAAVSAAASILRLNHADTVLCAAGQRSMDLMTFNHLEKLAADGRISGSISPGEGVGALVLKRLSDAQAESRPILGIIHDVSVASNHSDTNTAIVESTRRMAERNSELMPAIRVVESSAIGVVGSNNSVNNASLPSQKLIRTSAVDQFGFGFGVSGMLSLQKAILQMNHGECPVRLQQGDIQPQKLSDSTSRGTTLSLVQDVTYEGQAWQALVEGGTNLPSEMASSNDMPVTTTPPTVQTPTVAISTGRFQVFRLESPSPTDLHRQLVDLLNSESNPNSSGVKEFRGTSNARLAIRHEGQAQWRQHMEVAVNNWDAIVSQKMKLRDIQFCEKPSHNVQTAAMFPGQGSQYRQMFADWLPIVPQADDTIQQFDRTCAEFGLPPLADIIQLDAERLRNDLKMTQLSMLGANLFAWEVIKSLGVTPQYVLGHSFGEVAALVAVGSISVPNAVRIAVHRADAILEHDECEGHLVSVFATREAVAEIVDYFPGSVFVANVNGPEQIVVGGMPKALAGFVKLATADGLRCRELDVSRPFHTPLMEAACDHFGKLIESIEIRSPQMDGFISSVTNRKPSSADEIRQNLISQLSAPLDYVSLVQEVQAHGADVFLEVGPKNVLTGLNQRILGDQSVPCVPVDQPKKTADDQLSALRLHLEVTGLIDTHQSVESENNSEKNPKMISRSRGKVITFDATEKRRMKMRNKASETKSPQTENPSVPSANNRIAAETPPSTPVANGTSHNTTSRSSKSNGASIPVEDRFENPAVPPMSPSSSCDRSVMLKFMVDFIIEQTGYPADMITEDADLEADLGIDSIKRVQMIGELAQEFELDRLADRLQSVSLDQMTTIELIANFVVENDSDQAATHEMTTTPALQESAPESPVDKDAVVPDLTTNRHNVPVDPETRPDHEFEAASSESAVGRSELEEFAIQYVVEQTGYPTEMVELDADLEADLGIDSIKKAQLIGEFVETFELHHLSEQVAERSLDEFSTLALIVEFIEEATSPDLKKKTVDTTNPELVKAATPEVAFPTTTNQTDVVQSAEDRETTQQFAVQFAEREVERTPKNSLQQLELTGSPYEMGFKHGQRFAEEIHRILEKQMELLGPAISEMDELQEAQADPQIYFSSAIIEELRGIADGAELPFEMIVGHNLGLEHSHLPGCSRFTIPASRNGTHGAIHAINEDAPIVLAMGDVLSRHMQVRRPDRGNPHVVFSTAGQVGGLNGLNDRGLAVSMCNLNDRKQSTDLTKGKIPPVIVSEILRRAHTIDDAINVFEEYDRFGAWSLCLTDSKSDEVCLIEFDGPFHSVRRNQQEVRTTNHSQILSPTAEIPQHSQARFDRLGELMRRDSDAGVDVETAKHALRDRFDLVRNREVTHPTMNTVHRVDNLASIVMQPGAGVIWATTGIRKGDDRDRFVAIDLPKLFPDFASKSKRTVPSAVVPQSDRVMTRHIMRPVGDDALDGKADKKTEGTQAETPAEQSAFAGGVLIYGKNRDADEFASRMSERGIECHRLRDAESTEAILGEIDTLLEQETIPHLVLFSSRDDQAATNTNADIFAERRQKGLDVPFFLCQKWIAHLEKQQFAGDASLTGVVNLGGDFGVSSGTTHAEGGAIAGLLKGLAREYAELKIKVIDFPELESPANICDALVRETNLASSNVEVSYSRGKRRVLRTIPATLNHGDFQASDDLVAEYSGAWIVTGGARGITSVVAQKIGGMCQAHLHLLGSTSLDQIQPEWTSYDKAERKALKQSVMTAARENGEIPRSAWDKIEKALQVATTIRDLQNQGVNVRYHCCDLTDSRKIASVIQRIRENGVPITGIIHGAGYESSGAFNRKTAEAYDRTVAVKIDAAMQILEATKEDSLKFFIGFGSTSGRFGGLGQSDYSLASDMLCKLCGWIRRTRPGVKAVGFHWPPWDEIGMAARPESKLTLMANKVSFMPKDEGVNFVVEEMLAGFPETEVLIFDDPNSMEHGGNALPANLAEFAESSAEQRTQLPLVEQVVNSTSEEDLETEIVFRPTQDPFLLDHRHRKVPIMPFVVGLEAMVESAQVLAGDGTRAWQGENLEIVNGLRFHSDKNVPVRVQVQRMKDGKYATTLTSDFCNRQGKLVDAGKVHQTGVVSLGDGGQSPERCGSQSPDSGWETIKYDSDWQSLPTTDGRVYHGPTLQALKGMNFERDYSWGHIVACDEFQTGGPHRSGSWAVFAGTLDACLFAIDLHFLKSDGTAQLPRQIGQLKWYEEVKPGQELFLRIDVKTRNSEDGSFTVDFVLIDTEKHIVAEAESVVFQQSQSEGHGNGSPNKVSRENGDRISETGSEQNDVSKTKQSNALLLIDSKECLDETKMVAVAKFDASADVFLQQHLMNGQPVLPAVVGIEALAEAAVRESSEFDWIAVKEFSVRDRMEFGPDECRNVSIEVVSQDDFVDVAIKSGKQNEKLWQQAGVSFGSGQPAFVDCDNSDAIHQHGPMNWPEDEIMFHGPPFRSLQSMCFQREDGWANLVARQPEEIYRGRSGTPLIPAVLLDSAFVACGAFSWVLCGKRIEVPASVKSLIVARHPEENEPCRQRLFFNSQDRSSTEFDFTIFGEQGDIVLQVIGYRSRVVGRNQ